MEEKEKRGSGTLRREWRQRQRARAKARQLNEISCDENSEKDLRVKAERDRESEREFSAFNYARKRTISAHGGEIEQKTVRQ